MTVAPKFHKHFVARRGEVLRGIGEEFGGVVVSFPRNGVESDKVSLKGAKNCIAGAIERISEIVKNLEDMVTIDCEIEQQYHRTVMGAKGSKVQKITTDYNVQIKFPDKAVENGNGEAAVNGDRPAGSQNMIKITGVPTNVEAAKEGLAERVAELEKEKEEKRQ